MTSRCSVSVTRARLNDGVAASLLLVPPSSVRAVCATVLAVVRRGSPKQGMLLAALAEGKDVGSG